jgi:Flp pilus assembly protein TadD
MNATAIDSFPTSVEREIQRIRQLQNEGQHAQALQAAQALAVDAPEHRDVLYLIARSQRYLGKIDDALTTLAHLEQQHPHFSRLHEERGHCYVVMRDAPRAIDGLLRASTLHFLRAGICSTACIA